MNSNKLEELRKQYIKNINNEVVQVLIQDMNL